ncbi:unnamed protein product [Prunus armeniaca]|uniref:Uncharacterized protein n=1 Tax=Prunus armeniaca TaxID=36596 RepID=A0A6J5XJK0_PRUAR|nr:unnamed protein product [Prunus armeniaca]
MALNLNPNAMSSISINIKAFGAKTKLHREKRKKRCRRVLGAVTHGSFAIVGEVLKDGLPRLIRILGEDLRLVRIIGSIGFRSNLGYGKFFRRTEAKVIIGSGWTKRYAQEERKFFLGC